MFTCEENGESLDLERKQERKGELWRTEEEALWVGTSLRIEMIVRKVLVTLCCEDSMHGRID